MYIRTLVVDPKFGYSREVYLQDPTGRLVAKAIQSKHQYYPSIQTSLPHQVKVQLTPAGDPPLELDISVGAYLVNGMEPNDMTQFTVPNMKSFFVRDLTKMNQGIADPNTPPLVSPPPSNNPRNATRGVSWDGSGPLFR